MELQATVDNKQWTFSFAPFQVRSYERRANALFPLHNFPYFNVSDRIAIGKYALMIQDIAAELASDERLQSPVQVSIDDFTGASGHVPEPVGKILIALVDETYSKLTDKEHDMFQESEWHKIN